MKYLSLFSGIGGFELGIQQAYELHNLRPDELENSERPTELHNIANKLQQWECVGYSEIDKYATQIYQKHFPNHKAYGDITKIDPKDLPDFDLLVGGFPCQAFSIAGKRGGFDDTRGTLFFEIARIIRKKQPRLLLLENVKGLLSHDKGRTFHTIISTLDELGYDLQWQVLNSKNHGVPQNRERVFIVGHLRGTSRPQVFPIGGTTEEIKNNFETVALIPESYKDKGNYLPRERVLKSNISRAVTTSQNQAPYYEINQLNKPKHSNDRVYGVDGVSPTLNTMQGGRRHPFIAAERGRYNENGSTSQRLEARKDGVTNTLTGVEKDNRVVEDMKIRRLTPTECCRLQGFPDNWVDGISDSQKYKCLGNAVTVNVIKDIMKRLYNLRLNGG